MELTEVPREFSLALPERGLLRRREEAHGDPPARAPAARDGDPRRDRLRPRHRRAARRLQRRQRASPATDMGVLIITHYQRILHLVQPSHVHVMYQGRIVKEGGPELVTRARGEGLRLDQGRGRGRSRGLSRCRDRRQPTRRRGGRGAVPDPRSARSTAAARLPRLGRDLAEAGGRASTRARRLLPAAQREHPPRRLHARAGGDRRASRARAQRIARFIGAPTRGDDLHEERDRGDQPRRVLVGPPERRRGRHDRAHADGAPLEHRAVAAARAEVGAELALRRARPTTAGSTWTRSTRCWSAGRSSSRSRTSRTCSARSTRSSEIVARAHAAGAVVLVDGAQAVPHCASTCARSAPTSTASPATRSTGRPASACCTGGASCSRRCRRSWPAAT